MSKRSTCLMSLVLGLSLILAIATEAADPVGRWHLDDGAGLTAADSVGDHDGTLTGPLTWVEGAYGGALQFQGGSGSPFVDLGAWQTDGPDGLSLCLWVKWDGTNAVYQGLLSQREGTMYWWTELDPSGNQLRFKSNTSPQSNLFLTGEHLPQGEWMHVAFSHDAVNNTGTIYLNGEERLSGDWDLPAGDFSDLRSGIGVVNTADGLGTFNGALDEVMIFQVPLSQDEIMVVMQGGGASYPFASRPSPADSALLEATWANLGWRAGDSAISHDMYFGTNFDDVNDSAEGTFVGNLATTNQVVGFFGFPAPDGLQPGTTYYWRVDEVDDADPNSPWKGDIWSFSIPPRTAYEPVPSDETQFVLADVTLEWTVGFNAKLHTVYFGDNFDEVDNASLGAAQTTTTFTPGTLELGKTYYWRVDEMDPPFTHKGNVWSFTTVPEVPITDPDLIGWWRLDEGYGAVTVDWSGYGNHGTINNTNGGLGDGDSAWVIDPERGMVVSFSGDDSSGSYVSAGSVPAMTLTNSLTWTFWAKQDAGQGNNNDVILGNRYGGSTWIKFTPSFFEFGSNAADYAIDYDDLPSNTWTHHVVVKDGMDYTYYRNGVQSRTNSIDRTCEELPFFMGGDVTAEHWRGCMSDVRLYSKALTAHEIRQVMRGDPLLAWDPEPANGSTTNIGDAIPLTWSPGDNVSEHAVYFGTDRDAVDNADASDTTGVYRGRQTATSYSPPEGVEWGGGPYYWRVDEHNTDATVTKGKIWSFTVADYLTVDDFEAYNDLNEDEPGSNRIYLTWIDGFGTTTNGAVAGNLDVPLMSQGRNSTQAMPISYDNAGRTSEATRTLVSRKDWTEQGVTKLVVWFSGDAANAADRMFVALGNTIVYHPDDAATQGGGWNEWAIDLQEFATQGANLANVTSITLGFGTRNAPVTTGGTGTVEFDDIGLIQ